MSQQLTLNILQPLSCSFATFVPGGNQPVVQRLQALASGELGGNLYLWGETGAGKSHLLQALCDAVQNQSSQRSAIYISCQQLLALPTEAIAHLDQLAVVIFDDVDSLTGHDDWEEALFHFYNRAQQQATSLVFSASCAAHHIHISLPDLHTRLCACESYRLNLLDDAEKARLLTQAAQQRGFHIQDNVADFIMQRTARDTASLQRLIASLDQSSLSEHRNTITIPFVKQVLQL